MPAGAWSQAETPVCSDKLGWVGQPYWYEDCVFSVPTQMPGAPVGGSGEACLPGGDGPIGVAPGPHVRADITAAIASPEDRASLPYLGRRGRGAWRKERIGPTRRPRAPARGRSECREALTATDGAASAPA